MPGPLPEEVRLALSRGQTFEAIRILRAQPGLGLQEAVAAIESGLVPDRGDGLTAALELPSDVAAALAEGKTIEAVRLLRQRKGLSLRQAWSIVEKARRHRAPAPRRCASAPVVLTLAAILGLAGWLAAWHVWGREDACSPAQWLKHVRLKHMKRPGTQDCPDPCVAKALDDLQLLADLHRHGHRQGPGGDAETQQALALARVDRSAPLNVADIGCGTGASTLLLARLLNARIIAVDFLREFLDVLEERAQAMGIADRITTLACSMENLPFADEDFDILWAEGSIYNIGFERGVAAWRRFLKPGGLLVASEITWLTDSRPADLQGYWDAEYPEIDVASAKISILERQGYTPIGYFVLPERCWLDEYYRPLQSRLAAFRSRNGDTDAVRAIVNAEQREIELYDQYKAFYSYGFYIARKGNR